MGRAADQRQRDACSQGLTRLLAPRHAERLMQRKKAAALLLPNATADVESVLPGRTNRERVPRFIKRRIFRSGSLRVVRFKQFQQTRGIEWPGDAVKFESALAEERQTF